MGRKEHSTVEIEGTPGARQSRIQPRDRCTLLVLSGPTSGVLVPIEGDELVVGREADDGLRIDDEGLSRRHARFVRRADTWYVEDLGSKNGTWVAGTQAIGPRQLREGDRVQMGNGTLFRVSLQDAAEQEQARRIYDSAVRDALTQVYNRRYLDERLVSELAFAQRHGTTLSVLMIDLDHFKRVNDTLGHAAGDAALRVVAGALHRTLRTEDLLARYGGEELVVVARNIGARNAEILAERIRRAIAGLAIPWEGRTVSLTVSVGVATHSPDRPYATVDALVAAADRALYRAKEAGRNRTSSA